MSRINAVVEFERTGPSGNVFVVVAAVRRALLDTGHGDLAKEFMGNWMGQGKYEDVLAYCRQFVDLVAIDENSEVW